MQFTALIEAIVRQTTVLIAQLATTAGIRAPLAHIANQVFLDLVRELEAQGLGRKVVADMFGIALRSYQRKVQRLQASVTERDRTLWEATLEFVRAESPVTRARVLQRFAFDDEDVVRAVLHDLVESGLVYRAGNGASAMFRAADPDDLSKALQADEAVSNAAFVWITVYRHGPLDRAALADALPLPADDIDAALADLEAEGRVEQVPGAPPLWRSAKFLLPAGTTAGWEAALFHHYQAMVAAIVVKLQAGATRSLPADLVGGSTYEFPIWRDHPFEAQVLGLLRETRARASALRAAITAHNEAVGRPPHPTKVTFYVGQSLVPGADRDDLGDER